MLITGLRITGGALFLGAGLGVFVDEDAGALDTEVEVLGAPDVEEEELVFGCAVAFFSGSDLRSFHHVSHEGDLLAAAAAALRRESLLLPSPSSSTPCTGSSASEPGFTAIKGMSTSVSDFSISARLALQ